MRAPLMVGRRPKKEETRSMSGMGTGLTSNNPLIVGAFHHALWLQFLLVLLVGALLGVLRSFLRARQFKALTAAGTAGTSGSADSATPVAPLRAVEPVARRVLRIGFGLIWVLDGILQGQSAMPVSMPSQVLAPAVSGSPTWVQHLVNFGATMWMEHPVTAAAAAVWIQVGVGLLLLVAPYGSWSRFAGATSAVWGLIVWVFGEAFGSIMAPGATWLFGSPGAVLFYVIAGLLIALPARVWSTPALGRRVLQAMGLFFVGMAVLQAWPGRGFWQGQRDPHATAGSLVAMVRGMGETSQPSIFETLVQAFGRFDAAHGWAVNLFVVIALALIGAGFLIARPSVTLWAVVGGVVLCVADWVFIEDLGFFGGVGTDPNSMIPMALVFVSGYLALTRLRVEAPAVAPLEANRAVGFWRSIDPSYLLRIGAAVGAFAVVLLGAVPMAAASVSSSADPILTEGVNGIPVQEHVRAPGFNLIDQHGRPVTLSTFHGRTVALTFLDPVCTSDCPVIAQEFRQADAMLGGQAKHVALVAIVTNPIYRSIKFLQAFDRQEYLANTPNWYYLTGTNAQLTEVLKNFGASAIVEPAGAMVDHSEFADVIDPSGYIRTILSTDPGQATVALQSSFAGLLDSEIRDATGPTG
jgi:cytochrome oxidase Cu insertion factor (SCO1/SenC/PrrC family)